MAVRHHVVLPPVFSLPSFCCVQMSFGVWAVKYWIRRQRDTRPGPLNSPVFLMLGALFSPATTPLAPRRPTGRHLYIVDAPDQADRQTSIHIHRLCGVGGGRRTSGRSEEHTSELQSRGQLVGRLLLEKNKKCERTQSSM